MAEREVVKSLISLMQESLLYINNSMVSAQLFFTICTTSLCQHLQVFTLHNVTLETKVLGKVCRNRMNEKENETLGKNAGKPK